MTAADKLNARFRGLQGGLFSCVTKADVGAKAERLLDEHPDAYKDIHHVMALQSDLVRVRHRLQAVLNYKGA